MLGSRRASSPFLDLLGSVALKEQPAQLQLHLANPPEWGHDLLLRLHAWRVPDRTHLQGPISLVVRFCAQALLHKGGTREPLWRQTVRLQLDFGKGTWGAGCYREGWEDPRAAHTHTHLSSIIHNSHLNTSHAHIHDLYSLLFYMCAYMLCT